MPRPRRSVAKNTSRSVADENVDATAATSTLPMRKKRTLDSTETINPTLLVAQATIVNPPLKKLRKASSFYSPHQPSTHVPDRFDAESDKSGGSEEEAEEDWFDDPQDAQPVAQAPSKMSAVTVNERVVWQEPVHNPGSTSSHLSPAEKTETDAAIDRSLEGHSSGATETTVVTAAHPTWPTEINLVFHSGSKLRLLDQSDLLKAVFKLAFENVRKDLLFRHGFPNPNMIASMVRKCLVNAARTYTFHGGQYNASAVGIHQRLLSDLVYEANMIRIPRARMPIIRKEVKECCAQIVQAAFLPIQSEATIMEIVAKQLSNYNYMFPIVKGPSVSGTPRRTKPYRNNRIVTAIHNLYFSGGTLSIAHRFDHEFSRVGSDGVLVHEMPAPMVALVATALYAAIHEWRMGEYRSSEFSADAYLDVYNGHILTMRHIQAERAAAFRLMMVDLYSLASSDIGEPQMLEIASIDLDVLNG